MGLKYQLDTLDGLDDGVQSLYEEKDGKFFLSIEGLPQQEDTSGLKKTVDQLRKEKKDADTARQAWEKLGHSPEEIEELLAAKAKAEEEAAKKAGNFEELRKQDRAKWEKEKADLVAQTEALKASERKAIVDAGLTTALAKAQFTDTGLEFIPKVVADQIKIEDDNGTRVVRIYQPDGKTPMAGNGPDGMATFDDFAKTLSERHPDLVRGQMRSGGEKDPGSGGDRKSGDKTVSRSEFDKADPGQRSRWMADGYQVTDAA